LRHLTILPVALASVVLAGCSGSKAEQPGGSGRPQRPTLKVRVAPVAVRDVVYEIKALGSLEAQDMVQVTAQVEGVASEVNFHEGDRVTPRTVLLRIDPARYRLEAERARAALGQAEAERVRAEADLQRREALANSQLLSAEELTRSQSDSARLTAAVEVARAQAGIAQQNLQRSEVRAPIAGVINTRSIDTGAFVRTGTVLGTIVDTSRIRLRFKVSETESLAARDGGEVAFRVAALGPREFAARIYHVSRIADTATRQVEVLAWVKDASDLKPGFFAEVILSGERRANADVIPARAVQASEQGFVTYAVQDGLARLRPIQLGLRTGTGIVEILSGLKPGEIVVTEGSDRLADGVPVEPVVGEPRQAGGALPPAATPAAANR
jgi:multidrug efflux system membrane fusion protein